MIGGFHVFISLPDLRADAQGIKATPDGTYFRPIDEAPPFSADLVDVMSKLSNRKGDQSRNDYADIEVDLTLLLYHKLVPTAVISLVGVTAGTAAMAEHFGVLWMWLLCGVLSVICTLRLALAISFTLRDQSTLTCESASRWRLNYNRLTLLYCALLSLTAFFEIHVFPVGGGIMFTIAAFCLSHGISARLGTRAWMVKVCVSILLGSLAVAIWWANEPLSRVGVTLICFFLFHVFQAAQNQFDIVVDQLRSRRQLRVLAEQDALTRLANRRHFEARLGELCATPSQFAVLYLDLDRFKEVNDTFGHAAGDELLVQVGERLRGTVRATDLLARLGGDEFAILQSPLEDSRDATLLAARINREIAAPFSIAGEQVSIGASVGVRLSATQEDPDALLRNADKALYSVKQSGGGGFHLAEA